MSALPASVLGHAALTDPQLRLPDRPRFVDELTVVPIADGLAIVGGQKLEALRGRAAVSMLPGLLGVLDGTVAVDQLGTRLPGIPEAAVHAALATLLAAGAIEEGAAPPGIEAEEDDGQAELRAYLRRASDATRANRSGDGALARLRHARVTVAGPVEPATVLMESLGRAGLIGLSRQSRRDVAVDPATTLLVALVGPGTPDADLHHIDDRCAEAGVPLLLTSVTGDRIGIGPYVDRRHTACTRCHRRGGDGPVTPPAPPTSLDLSTWAALVATEVMHLCSRTGESGVALTPVVYDLATWDRSQHLFVRWPDCPVCNPSTPSTPLTDGDGGDGMQAFAFEQKIAFPPKHLLDPKHHQQHLKPANLARQYDTKRYGSAAAVDLPAAPAPAGTFMDRTAAPGRLDLAALSGVLTRSLGLRPPADGDGNGHGAGRKVSRYAPTGGNLGSPAAYVVTRGLPGLPAGVWFFQPFDRRLQIVRDDRSAARLLGLADRWVGPSDGPRVAIVLTAALGRVATKYHEFGYRVVHLDAGVALTHLHAVAAGLGLDLRSATAWDDGAVEHELALDPYDEPVTAVLTLTGTPGAP